MKVIAIVGATATGKSRLAMLLARSLGGEIVNADALQVYRGLEIGTAKPSLEDRRRVPHHLIDILDPKESFSAGEFARRAGPALRDIVRRRKVPMVVGGSGLYQRALFEGLAALPEIPAAVRAGLEERLAQEGLAALYRELQERDPETGHRLAAGDTQRVLRALEVLEATGRPLSAWQRDTQGPRQAFRVCRIGLTLPRPFLYDRIEKRVYEMVSGGWVEEVADLLAASPSADMPAFQAIGYRQIVRHLLGEWSLEEAVGDIVRATRRYAKRQETWFRKERGVHWFPAQNVERQLPEVLSILGCHGFSGGS